jgi:hypothetical protein
VRVSSRDAARAATRGASRRCKTRSATNASFATRLAAQLGTGAVHERAAGLVVGWAARAAHDELARLPALADRFEDAARFWPRPAAERPPTL